MSMTQYNKEPNSCSATIYGGLGTQQVANIATASKGFTLKISTKLESTLQTFLTIAESESIEYHNT